MKNKQLLLNKQISGNKSLQTLNLTGITLPLNRQGSSFRTWISHSNGLAIHTRTDLYQMRKESCYMLLDLQLKLSSYPLTTRKNTQASFKVLTMALSGFLQVISQIILNPHQKELSITSSQVQVSSSSKTICRHPTYSLCTPQKAKIHGTFSSMISQIIFQEAIKQTSMLSL